MKVITLSPNERAKRLKETIKEMEKNKEDKALINEYKLQLSEVEEEAKKLSSTNKNMKELMKL